MKTGIIITLFISLLLTLNCGPGQAPVKTTPSGAASRYIFYPPLPNPPKYQYLTTFSTSVDIQVKKSKFFKFVAGKDQEKPREIKKAYGVALHNGVIYTCDIGGGAVVTLDLKKHNFGYMGVKGSGKLIKPVNIDIDKEKGLLYVADMGRKQVVCFDLDGAPVKIYGVQDQFNPSDVAVYKNKLFVCDVKGHKIHVLDAGTGETLYTVGKAGSNDGELFHPTNIDIAHDRLYVSDTSNFRIQVFSPKGKFLSRFGKIGDRPGNFSRGKGIAVDREGRIYVVDAAFENVQVFDESFKILIYMFSPGREKHNINLPAGIAVDYDHLEYFKKYLSPKFQAEYLVFVTSNFGLNKVNVYAFGNYRQ